MGFCKLFIEPNKTNYLGVMLKILHYLRLYRLDVAILAVVSFFSGVLLAGGNIDPRNLILALLISFVSMNFIYSFNSYTDREIDAINKPWRPIPAGKVSPGNALYYCLFLLFASLVYPLFYIKSAPTVFFFYLMPLLGLLYSGKLLNLKKYLFGAVLAITLGQHSPLLLGYFLTTDSLDYLPVFVSTFFFCLAVIPLKDITDVKGDVKYGFQNWLAKLGQSKLLLTSFSILLLNICLLFVFNISSLHRMALLIFNLTPMALISLSLLKNQLNRVYKRIIVAVIVEGIIFLLFLGLFRGGELAMA